MENRTEEEALRIVTQVTGDKCPEYLGTKNLSGYYFHIVEASLDHNGDYCDMSKFYIPWDVELPKGVYYPLIRPQWDETDVGPTWKRMEKILKF